MTYGGSGARYLEAEIMSRPAEWLVPLLYEHLLSNLRRAEVQIEAGDMEGKATSLERAQAIVMELLSSLDAERGGEVATRLAALYAFFVDEIMTAGRSLDVVRLRRSTAMIAELHDAWTQAAEQVAPRGRQGVAVPMLSVA